MGCGGSKEQTIDENNVKNDNNNKEKQNQSTTRSGQQEDDMMSFKTIHSAIRWNKPVEEVSALIKTKELANIRDTGNGNYPLHIAAQNGHYELVKLLIKKGGDINCLNNKSNTPLHMSLSYDYIEVSEYLISQGADVNVENTSGHPARKGIDGDKCLAAVYLGEAETTNELLKAFQMCHENVNDLDKASFAGVGLRKKKSLGTEVWTDEVQDLFKGVMLKL